MYKEPTYRVVAKQFTLPLEEERLNHAYNNPKVTILDEKVFQDRMGNIVVFLKYEELVEPQEDEDEDPFFEGDDA
jgi:hypothetical protein